jgi:hypothetical protein
VQIGIEGDLGCRYIVEASSDLVDWVVIGSAQNDAWNPRFTDSGSGGFRQGFYRVEFEP